MKTGRILGIIGGLLTVVGVFLPWATATDAYTGTYASVSGLSVPVFGLLVLLFGVLGLLFVAIGKKITCTLAAVMGIIAFVMALIVYAIWTAILTTIGNPGSMLGTGYGMYMCLVGPWVLVVGSILARKEATLPYPQAPPVGIGQQPTQLN